MSKWNKRLGIVVKEDGSSLENALDALDKKNGRFTLWKSA